jgi:peroxiredoxin
MVSTLGEYNCVMVIRVGQEAPSFTVLSAEGASVSLADYQGRWVVLVFLRWLG